MRALDRLGAFRPSRLIATREAVQETHPSTVSAPVPVARDIVSHVREQIQRHSDDREELERLGRGFSSREMRACVAGLETWPHLRPAVAVVIRARPLGTMVPALWKAWQRLPFVKEISRLLVELGKAYGLGRAVGQTYGDAALKWIESPNPGLSIANWLDDRGWSYSDIDRLPDSPFSAETPLLRLVRNAVMTAGSTMQLRAEGTRRLLAWSLELGPEDRLAFERNYLARLHSAEWGTELVHSIHVRHGLPRRPRRPAFWDPVARSVRDEFQRIVIERMLSEAFGDDTDRHVYWRQRIEAETPKDVTKGMAGTTDYLVIDFGGFVVVEFFEIGNAAYFYSARQWEDVYQGSARYPSSLKTKYDSPRGRRRDNRLIHQPGWERKADRMMDTWKQSYR